MRLVKRISALLLSIALLATTLVVLDNRANAETIRKNTQVEAFVTRLYEVVLNRTPDEDGLNNWYGKLVNKEQTASEVVYGFFFSEEYTKQEKDNISYVNDLYHCMFDREGDAAGVAYWKVRLDAGVPRLNVLKGFVDSIEFTNLCNKYDITKGTITTTESVESVYNVHNFVVRLYQQTLGRDPDYAGMIDWQKKLLNGDITGAEAAYGFIFSEECIKNTTEDKDFVNVLYKSMLGREADEEGLGNWVNALAAGNSREAIFAGFVNSKEFTELCEEYGITRGEFSVGRKIDPSKPMIALTFDDGPATGTMRILETLEKYDQVATFFVVGSNAKYYQDTLKKMEEIGCEIGNHTYNHPSLSSCTAATIINEIASTNEYIFSAVGHNATVMRPPYGAYNDVVKANVGLPLILWSVDTRDWATRSTTSTVNSVLTDGKDGSIVLMHDIHPSTVDAACILIPELVNRGYQLVTVSELAYYKGIELVPGEAYYSIK